MADTWAPSATLEAVAFRAQILFLIRDFFRRRRVMEVETPLLSQHTNLDPYLQSIRVPCYRQADQTGPDCYLQTSPEFAMKRLLAAGSGSIYQVCKAFRLSEQGRHHNPEFTMLEWYQVGLDYFQLMTVVVDLIQYLVESSNSQNAEPLRVKKISYQEAFFTATGLDPFLATHGELKTLFEQCANSSAAEWDRDALLQYLFAIKVESSFDKGQLVLVYDYPLSQSPLAKRKRAAPQIAERFELYMAGMELGNGYSELTNHDEQLQRFQSLQEQRRKLGKDELAIDHHFIAALANGIPDCAGVAIGLDRLIMALTSCDHIDQVVNFPFPKA